VVGCADGSVAKIDKKNMTIMDETLMCDSTMGIKCLASSSDKIYALNGYGHLHHVSCTDPLASNSVFMTSSIYKIGDIVFPAGFGEVFATRCKDEISIWNVGDQRELLKI
jgi:hypothetical protein